MPPIVSAAGPVAATQSAPAATATPSTASPVNIGNYASFGRRLVAMLLDGFILGAISAIIIFIFSLISVPFLLQSTPNMSNPSTSVSAMGAMAGIFVLQIALQLIVEIGYLVYFIGAKGQTPGKMALGIKVIKVDTGSVPGFGGAFLREVIGKLVSSLVFMLGYFWMLWDGKKQTWHDKIAGTVVVRI